MNIAAIMPCRGRPEQTVANVKRLLATAGYEDWALFCVVDNDHDVMTFLNRELHDRVGIHNISPRQGYWRCLASLVVPEATHFVNLANDLLPGQHWLKRAVDAYHEAFPGENDYGLLGFNGDSHEVGHSCHFLIDRRLLDSFGGWPVWYDHNFGDTELCQRAIELGFYAKAPWAILFHNHVYFGADNDDVVYAEGRKAVSRDEQLYLERKRAGWPTVPQTL